MGQVERNLPAQISNSDNNCISVQPPAACTCRAKGLVSSDVYQASVTANTPTDRMAGRPTNFMQCSLTDKRPTAV
jgi:hypothetical protein